MTEFVFTQLKKLADNQDHFIDCLEYWGGDPNKEQEAIKKLIAPYFLKGKLLCTQLSMVPHNGETIPVFSFMTSGDPLKYIMFGMVDPEGYPHIAIAKSTLLKSLKLN